MHSGAISNDGVLASDAKVVFYRVKPYLSMGSLHPSCALS